MFRIISGKWKGKKITAPKNFNVRPTTDFAKEALFNIIESQYDISEIEVLDLFSGIGSVSYEFASRGARKITAVDIEFKHLKFIEETAKTLDLKEINCIRNDAFKFLSTQNSDKFEMIFADPPYHFQPEQYQKIIDLVFEKNILKPQGTLIIEHQSKTEPFQAKNHIQTRKYGNVAFSFFQ